MADGWPDRGVSMRPLEPVSVVVDEWSTWERRIRAEERKAGADRERWRIRRAQAGALAELRKRRDIDADHFDAQLAALEAATKTPRRGRR